MFQCRSQALLPYTQNPIMGFIPAWALPRVTRSLLYKICPDCGRNGLDYLVWLTAWAQTEQVFYMQWFRFWKLNTEQTFQPDSLCNPTHKIPSQVGYHIFHYINEDNWPSQVQLNKYTYTQTNKNRQKQGQSHLVMHILRPYRGAHLSAPYYNMMSSEGWRVFLAQF